MNKGTFCMGCMHPLPEGRSECGICGYPAGGDNAALYLSVRTVLSDRYIVGKMLQADGDSAVYMGYDQVLKSPIFIREFLPDTLCEREKNGSLRVINGCEHPFNEYHEQFRIHARSLARMRELTTIIAVYDIFEQNNTTYVVAEYVEGNSLDIRLKQLGGFMRWDDARPLFMPLISSLISLHSAGLHHFGIYPGNIIVGTDNKLHLLGFCIEDARRVSTDLRPKLLPGYSAPEQYAYGQPLGTWTDVYGLAATIFRTITGNPPPEGSRRAKDSNDLFVPGDVAAELPDYVASALFNALLVNPDNRTKTLEQFRDQISTAPAVSKLREDEPAVRVAEVPEEEEIAPKKDNRVKYILLISLSAFVFLLLIAGLVIFWLFQDQFRGDESSVVDSQPSIVDTTPSTTASTGIPVDHYAVPDLVGQSYYEIREKSFAGNFKVEVQYKKYSDKPKGEILSQTPTTQNTAEEGTTIQVVISAGPEKLTVPDVRGWNYKQAQVYLEALGFVVQTVPVVSQTVDFELVEEVGSMGQSLPEGSIVVLRYSETRQTTTTVPTEDDNWWN